MIDKWKRKENENDKMINSIKRNDTLITIVNQNNPDYIVTRSWNKYSWIYCDQNAEKYVTIMYINNNFRDQ